MTQTNPKNTVCPQQFGNQKIMADIPMPHPLQPCPVFRNIIQVIRLFCHGQITNKAIGTPINPSNPIIKNGSLSQKACRSILSNNIQFSFIVLDFSFCIGYFLSAIKNRL